MIVFALLIGVAILLGRPYIFLILSLARGCGYLYGMIRYLLRKK